MRVLIDTNIIVDVLQRREPWFGDGRKIFLAAANRQITACITAKEAADIHYFARRQLRGEENADEKAREILANLFALFEVIDTLAEDCRAAFPIRNGDYEDAVMIASAVRVKADRIVTRNPEHFKASPVPVMGAGEFVRMMEEKQDASEE